MREHIEAEVNRLLLKESDNNQKWFNERLSPELQKIEEDRKHLENIRKQHEEVLAAQSSIYSTLTQLSQTVKDIPQAPIDKLGSPYSDLESTSNSVTKIAESLGDIVIRISTLERTSQDENPGVTNRFDNLEKFIQRILQTQAELQTQINNLPKNAHPQQGHQMAPVAPLENPQTMPLINSLRYDMDNIKNDIFLHKQKAEDFFRKHDMLEKKVLNLEDGAALQKFGKAIADISAQNFMATNFSKIGFPENSHSQGYDPIHQEFAPRAINAESNIVTNPTQNRPSAPTPSGNPYGIPQPQMGYPKHQVVQEGPQFGGPAQPHKASSNFHSAGMSNYDMRNSLGGDDFDRALDNMSMIDKQMDQSMDVFDDIFGTNSMRQVTSIQGQQQPPIGVLGGPPKRTGTGPSLMPIIDEEIPTEQDSTGQPYKPPVETFYNPQPLNTSGPAPVPVKLGGRQAPEQTPRKPEPVPPAPVVQQVATPLRKVTGDESNTSLLNQSLNSSIRIPKRELKNVDKFIVPGLANAVEMQRTSSLGQEINSAPQPTNMLAPVADDGAKDDDDDDESILELNMDEEGFLLDEQGQRILNDLGQPIKLSDEQIEALKVNGMYEEVETSVMK